MATTPLNAVGLDISGKSESFFVNRLQGQDGLPSAIYTSTSDADPDPPYVVVICKSATEIFPESANYKLDMRIAIVTQADGQNRANEHRAACVAIKAVLQLIPQQCADIDADFRLLGYQITDLDSSLNTGDALISSWSVKVGGKPIT